MFTQKVLFNKTLSTEALFNKTWAKKLLSTSVAASLLLSPLFLSTQAMAETMTSTQHKQLTEITTLLKQNPTMIEGLHKNLTQYISGQSSIATTLKDNYDYLYNNPLHPYFGAAEPKLTVINFTDYNCPYCKRLESGLETMLKSYPEVRVVNIYLPFQQRLIPGMETNTAWYALNVWENDRENYAEVHRLMMAKPSRHDQKSIMKIAELTNTQDALKVTAKNRMKVEKNERIFSQLGLRGTPSLIIGDEIIPGFIPQAQLEALIKTQLASQ
jgi:protein-disulfide isomerase